MRLFTLWWNLWAFLPQKVATFWTIIPSPLFATHTHNHKNLIRSFWINKYLCLLEIRQQFGAHSFRRLIVGKGKWKSRRVMEQRIEASDSLKREKDREIESGIKTDDCGRAMKKEAASEWKWRQKRFQKEKKKRGKRDVLMITLKSGYFYVEFGNKSTFCSDGINAFKIFGWHWPINW